MATKWAIDPDSKLWIVRSSPSWAIDTGDGDCCCCLTYDQAHLNDTMTAVWSGVTYDFDCEGFSGGGSAKLLTAGLNASWSLAKISETGGFITYSLTSTSIATDHYYPVSQICTVGESSGTGSITVILQDTGNWQINAGISGTPAAGLFRASGTVCMPNTVLNEIVTFGFNFLGTVVDLGRFGSVSFSFP